MDTFRRFPHGGPLYFSRPSPIEITLSFSSVPEVSCYLSPPWYENKDDHRPSLQSFLQASASNEHQDLRLNGLAVLSTLANACQPLVDVNKAKMQITKIALVSVENMTVCSWINLVLNAQNAGYSVVIYFGEENYGPLGNVTKLHTQEEILIPFGTAESCSNNTNSHSSDMITNYDVLFKAVDKTSVNIIITGDKSENLRDMAEYLKKLYYWFLFGPFITLEWLRRKKKLCCVTGISQQVAEESAADDEERGQLVTRVGESREQNVQDITDEGNEDESQPLIIITDTNTDLTRNDNVDRCRIIEFLAMMFKRGALNNLKLTALRTVALGLTLTLSFSSSMHIIRKLMKPQESVFEGLSEK
ncbi:hypothetical protein AWC38_SpisGene7935 [Stylophora pistillata]|uniref:Uncharacterized protein n=1 Tax=Stylophora pistillata TaxID=50429 RepID=A0A2B4SFM4_STYPI|nr:hypothetical protein AWC38_SpisGene7935 [Stylophora pistillata]